MPYAEQSMRLLTPDDYMDAARIVASCKPGRLKIVLSLLESGGWKVPEVQEAAMIVPKENTSDISYLIKSAKIRTGLTTDELANIIGISSDVMRSYEKKQRFPKSDRYRYIARMLRDIEEEMRCEL